MASHRSLPAQQPPSSAKLPSISPRNSSSQLIQAGNAGWPGGEARSTAIDSRVSHPLLAASPSRPPFSKHAPLPAIGSSCKKALGDDEIAVHAALFAAEATVSALASALTAIASKRAAGLYINDYEHIATILERVRERDDLQANSEFVASLCRVIMLLSQPTVYIKTSDMLKTDSIVAAMRAVGHLIAYSSSVAIQITSASAIALYLKCAGKSPADGITYEVMLARHQKIISESGVCNMLVMALFLDPEPEPLSAFLATLCELTSYRGNETVLINAMIVWKLCNILAQPRTTEFARNAATDALEIFWNLIELAGAEAVMEQIDESCLNDLCVSTQVLMGPAAMSLKEERNDLLITHTLLASSDKFLKLATANGMLAFLIDCTTQADILGPMKTHYRETIEDYEMHKELISLINKFTVIPDAIPIIASSDFISMLAQYLAPVVTRKWTLSQFVEVQDLSLVILANLAPLMVDKYLELNLSSKVMKFFDWATQSVSEPGKPIFPGASNGVFSTDDFSLTRTVTAVWNNGRRGQQRGCLGIIRNMVATNNNEVIRTLGDSNLVPLFRKYIARQFPPFDVAIDQLCVLLRTDALIVLASIFDFDVKYREEFGPDGIANMCKIYLELSKYQLCPLNAGFEPLFIASIGTVWCVQA